MDLRIAAVTYAIDWSIYRNGVCAGCLTFRILVVADFNLQPLEPRFRVVAFVAHTGHALDALRESAGSRVRL